MTEIFGVPIQALMGQLTIGLVNGSFYAILSLGLAVIFGMLNIVNFAHGALYMVGAFFSWLLLDKLGVNYWWSLLLAPLGVGIVGVIIEKTMLRWLYQLDHLYGLLLTFGLALILEGLFRDMYGVSGQPYELPDIFRGTLMPKACTSFGFSVPARRYEPSRVRSITYQVPTQTISEANTTKARYLGKNMKPRLNAPRKISGSS